jgi:signal transduction histidine kinase
VQRVRALLKDYAFDAAILLAAVGGVVEVLLNRGKEYGPSGSLSILVPGILAATLPLLARRWLPVAAPMLVIVLLTAMSFAEGEFVPYTFVTFLAVVASTFLLGLQPNHRLGLAGLALVYAAGIVITLNDPQGDWGDSAFVMLAITVAWIAAYALRRRLDHAAELERRARVTREEAVRAVDEERQRIARELHDVVAHSISVMTVQAGGVRRLLRPEQEREREALQAIEDTGRQALAEMRRLLGILKGANETAALAPQPSLRSLEQLLAQVREAGLPVVLEVEGERLEVPPGVDLSAYRIVQEALTNALKHAGPARAKVKVCYRDDCVEVEVANDGRSVLLGAGDGHGVAGMRERVALYGGTLQSGPRDDGSGYVVRAKLPIHEEDQ